MGSIHMSKQEQDLMELTLQVKNRKENDNKYAKFRGDNLIGVWLPLTSAPLDQSLT